MKIIKVTESVSVPYNPSEPEGDYTTYHVTWFELEQRKEHIQEDIEELEVTPEELEFIKRVGLLGKCYF